MVIGRRVGHKTGLMTGSFEWIELITGVARRRRWRVEEKLRTVAESFAGEAPSRTGPPGPNAYARLGRFSRPFATLVLTIVAGRVLPAVATTT